MELFVTADVHLDHPNILKHCKRPWLKDGDIGPDGKWINTTIRDARTFEMNEAIIHNWNAKVPKQNSTVIILGDFCWHRCLRWLNALNGKKILVKGNHDRLNRFELSQFQAVYDIYQTKLYDCRIVGCHYPMVSWNRSCHGSWHLYGHVHGRLSAFYANRLAHDCGMDCNAFQPLHFSDIEAIMTRKLNVVDENENKLQSTNINQETDDHE
jgi:calcineurin-like phosphoesterase family protein